MRIFNPIWRRVEGKPVIFVLYHGMDINLKDLLWTIIQAFYLIWNLYLSVWCVNPCHLNKILFFKNDFLQFMIWNNNFCRLDYRSGVGVDGEVPDSTPGLAIPNYVYFQMSDKHNVTRDWITVRLAKDLLPIRLWPIYLWLMEGSSIPLPTSPEIRA